MQHIAVIIIAYQISYFVKYTTQGYIMQNMDE